jgi:hypothetical protein
LTDLAGKTDEKIEVGSLGLRAALAFDHGVLVNLS